MVGLLSSRIILVFWAKARAIFARQVARHQIGPQNDVLSYGIIRHLLMIGLPRSHALADKNSKHEEFSPAKHTRQR